MDFAAHLAQLRQRHRRTGEVMQQRHSQNDDGVVVVSGTLQNIADFAPPRDAQVRLRKNT